MAETAATREPRFSRLARWFTWAAAWLAGVDEESPREVELADELKTALAEARKLRAQAAELEDAAKHREIDFNLERRQLEAEKDAAVVERQFLADLIERNQRWVQADTAAHVASSEIARRRRDE